MTLTLFRFNHQEKKLYYTGAGHGHIIIYKKALKKCLTEKSGGIALGMVPDNSKIVKEKLLDFSPDDLLIVYSDGVTEAKNIYGELFGLNRLVEIIEQNAAKRSIEELMDIVSEQLNQFMENHFQEDDMSLIICKFGQELFSSLESKNTDWKFR